MQSQQKKIKWSRGETADALEERTDTGITQVSVAKLENIVADIYGNISRRPALKLLANNTPSGYAGVFPVIPDNAAVDLESYPASFVFTINADSYIIFVIGQTTIQGFWIVNNEFQSLVDIIDPETGEPPIVTKPYGNNGKMSFAQSNNWGVLSNVFDYTVVLRLTSAPYSTPTITFEKFKFSAPWYAPNGTQTKQITSTEVTGLNFDASTIGQYTYTEFNGETTVYSWISTGISQAAISGVWSGPTTTYYCHYSSSNIWIDTNPSGGTSTSSFTMTNGTTYVGGQQVGTQPVFSLPITLIIRETTAYFYCLTPNTFDVSANMTISQPDIANYIPAGSIVQFPNNGAYMRVEGYDSDGHHLRMYGEFLTPVADDTAHDDVVKIETGYISLQNYQPTEFTFSQQRLYATKWTNVYDISNTQSELPGYVVGSQIARFTDFKNNYNTSNEPVVIDINTQYQEKVNFVSDYNGIKIFTSDSEYAYAPDKGVGKQSTNGSSETVRPIVFGSALLYVDKTDRQIRALQYEFQTDINQSNVINQMCQEDLIFKPVAMSSTYDKEHHTGSFVYVNQLASSPVPLAVCNFVPGNQAEIWSRWAVPTINWDYPVVTQKPVIGNSITVNNKVWFIVFGESIRQSGAENLYNHPAYSLAELDYSKQMDFEINADPSDTRYVATRNFTASTKSLIAWTHHGTSNTTVYTEFDHTLQVGSPVYRFNGVAFALVTAIDTQSEPNTIQIDHYTSGWLWERDTSKDIMRNDLTFPNATVSVFDGDQYMWDDTLDQYGKYTKPLTDLTNPRVGFMINATLESHPLDIQGKTYTEKKRIGKCVAVIRNTEPGAFTVCDKTGYTSPDKKTVNFYGCTGMKDQIRYTIKNIKGAKFTIESLTMIVEYGTLDS